MGRRKVKGASQIKGMSCSYNLVERMGLGGLQRASQTAAMRAFLQLMRKAHSLLLVRKIGTKDDCMGSTFWDAFQHVASNVVPSNPPLDLCHSYIMLALRAEHDVNILSYQNCQSHV